MLSIQLRSARLIRLSMKRLGFVVFVSVIAGLGSGLAAQAPPLLPAVDLRTSSHAFTGDTWPADFNRDGRTDLVGDTAAGIAVALGNGDATFATPAPSGTRGEVIAVGDLNGDGKPDVVAKSDTQLIVLPGTGTSALGPPRSVMDGQSFTFASVADMDNDAIRDLVVGQEGTSLHIFPGSGDFSFDPPFTFETGAWPHGVAVADLDGDGLRDVVVAHRYARQITVYRNGGTFAFTPTDLPIQHSSTDVTVRDVNGDGRLDLIVSARGDSDDAPWSEGLVYVFLGNGDGTFGPPATFPTAAGTQSVVVGDFTRDGTIDVATANRSFAYLDTMCTGYYGADSVSVLPGRGDGTFGASVDFALAPALSYYEGEGFQNVVGTLNTSDLNGDGRTDLITSHGKILLNAAPRANRPPVVSAGEDQTVFDRTDVDFPGSAAGDPDHHLLRVNWSQNAPREGNVPLDRCVELPSRSGNYLFYLTASDGHGGVTSDDVTITHVNTEEWPAIWASGDVGAVGAAGSSSYDSSTGMFTCTRQRRRHLGKGGRVPLDAPGVDRRLRHDGQGVERRAYRRLDQGGADGPRRTRRRRAARVPVRHAVCAPRDHVPTTAGRERAEPAHLGSRGDGAGLDPPDAHGRCDQRVLEPHRRSRIVDAHRPPDADRVGRHRGDRLRGDQSPRQ